MLCRKCWSSKNVWVTDWMPPKGANQRVREYKCENCDTYWFAERRVKTHVPGYPPDTLTDEQPATPTTE